MATLAEVTRLSPTAFLEASDCQWYRTHNVGTPWPPPSVCTLVRSTVSSDTTVPLPYLPVRERRRNLLYSWNRCDSRTFKHPVPPETSLIPATTAPAANLVSHCSPLLCRHEIHWRLLVRSILMGALDLIICPLPSSLGPYPKVIGGLPSRTFVCCSRAAM